MKRALLPILALGLFVATPAEAQDVDSRVDSICCGGGCCFIDSVCFTDGDTDPADSCNTCDTSSSRTDWTRSTAPACSGGGTDAGSPGTDAGGGGGGGDGGCSAGGPVHHASALLLGAALVFLRRRR